MVIINHDKFKVRRVPGGKHLSGKWSFWSREEKTICPVLTMCFCFQGNLLRLLACMLSHVRLFVTPWTVARQAPLSMEFSRQEYWVGFHFLFQGIFPTQGLNSCLLHCRQILYHLSYQGSLVPTLLVTKCESLERPCIYFLKCILLKYSWLTMLY